MNDRDMPDHVQSENGFQPEVLRPGRKADPDMLLPAKSVAGKSQEKSGISKEGESTVVPIQIRSSECSNAKIPEYIRWTSEDILGDEDYRSSRALMWIIYHDLYKTELKLLCSGISLLESSPSFERKIYDWRKVGYSRKKLKTGIFFLTKSDTETLKTVFRFLIKENKTKTLVYPDKEQYLLSFSSIIYSTRWIATNLLRGEQQSTYRKMIRARML